MPLKKVAAQDDLTQEEVSRELHEKDLKQETELRKLQQDLKDLFEAVNDNRATAASEDAENLAHKAEQLVDKTEQQPFKQDVPAQTDAHLSITNRASIGMVFGGVLAAASGMIAGVAAANGFVALAKGDYESAELRLTVATAICFCWASAYCCELVYTNFSQREAQNASGFFAARPVVAEKGHSEFADLTCRHS